jgi:hypothetical protein
LQAYFQSWRHAFDNRTIMRGIVVVEGDYIACQTTMEGDFVRGSRSHRSGRCRPMGSMSFFDLINIFR